MATITLTIPDAQIARVITAFSVAYNYQLTIPGPLPTDPRVPNPETRAQFMRQHIRNFVRDTVRSVAVNAAAEVARETELALPTIDITVT